MGLLWDQSRAVGSRERSGRTAVKRASAQVFSAGALVDGLCRQVFITCDIRAFHGSWMCFMYIDLVQALRLDAHHCSPNRGCVWGAYVKKIFPDARSVYAGIPISSHGSFSVSCLFIDIFQLRPRELRLV